jgi:hypothetical protein
LVHKQTFQGKKVTSDGSVISGDISSTNYTYSTHFVGRINRSAGSKPVDTKRYITSYIYRGFKVMSLVLSR